MNDNNEAIDYQKMGDFSNFLAVDRKRSQSLKGFNEEYVDIVDYIVRTTHKIWEENGIGLIYDHYQHDVTIWTSDGLTYSRDIVIEKSIQTQAAFPDIRLYTDEVIWSGNDEDGFHTSHRIIWVGRNTGYSVYGPPTGRRIVRAGIANCFVRQNRVVKEWIARDEISLLMQLGFDPKETALRMVQNAGGVKLGKPAFGEQERLFGQSTPAPVHYQPKEQFDVEDFVRSAFQEVWNWRLLNRINFYYAPNHFCHTAGSRNLYGLGELKAYILSILAAFPDAVMNIDHMYWMGNDKDGYRVANRWTLQGTHTGPGIFGEPTGSPIQIMGISHHHIKDGKFIEEWMSFDEFALLKQIYAFQNS